MGPVYPEVREEVRHVGGEPRDDALGVATLPGVEGDGREAPREVGHLLEEPPPAEAESVDEDEGRPRAPNFIVYRRVLRAHRHHAATSRLAPSVALRLRLTDSPKVFNLALPGTGSRRSSARGTLGPLGQRPRPRRAPGAPPP